MASSSTISSVNTYLSSLITDLMTVQQQPLNTLQTEKGTLQTKQSVFSDLSSKLSSFRTAVDAFSSASFTSVFDKRSAAVSEVATGRTVLTANAAAGAAAGVYHIQVDANGLAQAQRVRGDRQLNVDQALGLTGQFVVGGAAARSQATVSTIANTVNSFGTASLATGQLELGTGSYFTETRQDNNGAWQFRMVDSDGQAVSIRSASNTSFTSSWQAMPTSGGAYDTGRGLTLDFGTDSASYQAAQSGAGAAKVNYTAQGALIDVTSGSTLNDVASAINKATYADGNGLTATVVDKQLVLSAAETGLAHSLSISDKTGTVLQSLGVLTATKTFKNSLQDAQDASFSINGMPITRSHNSGLDDVVSGLTINLATDAAGQTATLTVGRDVGSVTSTVQNLFSQFNSLTGYLRDKTSVTGEGNTATTAKYTRGVLADDYAYTTLRQDMMSDVSRGITGLPAGSPTTLSQLGITMDSSLNMSVSDTGKFQAALNNNPAGVKALLQAVADRLDTRLDRYTDPTRGTLTLSQNSLTDQLKNVDNRIADMNQYLKQYQASLQTQYAGLQSQILSNFDTQSQLSAMSGYSATG